MNGDQGIESGPAAMLGRRVFRAQFNWAILFREESRRLFVDYGDRESQR
jgi:hypothetical protein